MDGITSKGGTVHSSSAADVIARGPIDRWWSINHYKSLEVYTRGIRRRTESCRGVAFNSNPVEEYMNLLFKNGFGL